MHLIVAFAATAIVSAGLGYGFRGWIHHKISTETVVGKSDLSSFATRVEKSAYNAEQTVKTELLKIAGDIRKAI